MEKYFTKRNLLEYAFVKNYAFQAVVRAATLLHAQSSHEMDSEDVKVLDWRRAVIIMMAFPHCDIPRKTRNPASEEEMHLRKMEFTILMNQDPVDPTRFDPYRCSMRSNGSKCL